MQITIFDYSHNIYTKQLVNENTCHQTHVIGVQNFEPLPLMPIKSQQELFEFPTHF